MTITTVDIVCDVGLPNNTEFPASRIDFQLSGPDYDTVSNDVIPAVTVSAILDGSGTETVGLWPVDRGIRNTFYNVILQASFLINGRTVAETFTLGRIAPPSDEASYGLADLLAQSTGGITVGSKIYATLADAVAAALEAAENAQEWTPDYAQSLLDQLNDQVADAEDAADRAETWGPRTVDTIANLAADTALTSVNTPLGSPLVARAAHGLFRRVEADGDHVNVNGLNFKVDATAGHVYASAYGDFTPSDALENGGIVAKALDALKEYGNNIITGGSGQFRPTLMMPGQAIPLRGVPAITNMSYLRFVGSGRGGTRIVADEDDTAPIFDLGIFTLTPSGAFSGTTQHALFRAIHFDRPAGYSLTETGSRVGCAIRDNGGGNVYLDEVVATGFGYGFCGSFGSDFTQISMSHFRRNDVDIYLGPGSQQIVIDKTELNFSGEGIVCDAVFQLAVNDCQMIDHKIANITIEAPATTTRLGVSRANLQNNHGGKIEIIRPWFETGAGPVAVPSDWHSQRHIWLKNPEDVFPRGLHIDAPIIVSGVGLLPAKDSGETYSFLDAQVGNDIEIDTPLLFGTRIDKLVHNNAALSQRILVRNRRNISSEASVETFSAYVDNGTVELTDNLNRQRRKGVSLRDYYDFGDTDRYSAKRWADGFEQTLYQPGSGEVVAHEHNYSTERFRFRAGGELRGFAFRTAQPSSDSWQPGELALNRGTDPVVAGWLNVGAGSPGTFDVLTGRGKRAIGATAAATSHAATLQLGEGAWDVTVRWSNGDGNHAQFAKFLAVWDAASVNTINVSQQIGTTITKGTVIGALAVAIDASGLMETTCTTTSSQLASYEITAIRVTGAG